MNRLRNNPKLLAPILAALAMVGPFSIDAIFPAFAEIQAEFRASASGMQQIISLYIAAVAVMALLHGAISDAFGRRIVLMVSLALFALSCLGCAAATSLSMLLGFRILQGASGGAGLILGRAIIRDRFSGAEATNLMAQVTLIFGVAPAIAPVIGGWILGVGSWRTVFLAMFGFTLLLVAICTMALPETHPRERRIPFGPRSLLKAYSEIFSDARFVLMALSAAMATCSFFLYIALAPTIILGWLHLGENAFYWLFAPTIGGIMFGAFLSQKLSQRMDNRSLLRIGWGLVGFGCVFSLAESALLPPGLPWTVLPPGLMGLGSALAQPTLTLMMLDRFPDKRGTAASLQSATTLAANALVSGVVSVYVADSALTLSIGAGLISALGFFCWWLQDRMPPDARALQSASTLLAEANARETEAAL